MNITVSGYNRPLYLRQTLAALRRCDGIADCRVVVLLDPCDETERCEAIAGRYDFESLVHPEHRGCNRAIRAALAYGFDVMGSEFHIHFEDDTVPTRDALRWFAWARDEYRDQARIMNISGYQRLSNGRIDECGARKWFTPWGWGLWRDRWPELAAGWNENDTVVSWDHTVTHVLRAGRSEVFPAVSRIQNIGALKGSYVPHTRWHRANQQVRQTADDISGPPVTEWRHVIEADNADHA